MNNDQMFILLAEDDEDDRQFFKEAIERMNLNTVLEMVTDGVFLIEYLKNNPEKRPHLIFLDLNMPRKDGFECLREIRGELGLSDLPIAIYSTSNASVDMEEAFRLGANIYIRKPSDFTMLKNIIAKVVSINWHYHNNGLNIKNFVLSI
ncbi:MAG TPA: response regulator [Lentimicrobium sp.]|nr:response regulator [Lentimicrobium sp.]